MSESKSSAWKQSSTSTRNNAIASSVSRASESHRTASAHAREGEMAITVYKGSLGYSWDGSETLENKVFSIFNESRK